MFTMRTFFPVRSIGIVSFRTSVGDRHTWSGTLGCCYCPDPPPQLVTIQALPRRRRQVLPHGGNLRLDSSPSSSLPHKVLECPQLHRGTSWCMAHRCTALEDAVSGTSERVPTLPMGWQLGFFPLWLGPVPQAWLRAVLAHCTVIGRSSHWEDTNICVRTVSGVIGGLEELVPGWSPQLC